MTLTHYILDGHEVVPVEDVLEWGAWFENSHERRRVAEDFVGSVRVSTVFIGLDHQWGDGPPLLFETMVFGGRLDDFTDRYSTWDEAEAGHRAALAKVLASRSWFTRLLDWLCK